MRSSLQILLAVVAIFGYCSAEYKLRILDTEYLPKSYSGAEEIFEYNVGSAEQSAVDQNQPIIYVSGLNYIHVIDISDPTSLSRPYYVAVAEDGTGEGTDVETCGNRVAVSYDDFGNPLDGRVLIYSTYDASQETPMQLQFSISVGSMPDMIKFTKDCSRLIVAVEAELRTLSNGTVVDPEGQVAIITFNGDEEPSTVIAGFQRFNDREAEYVAKGVRKVYNGQQAGFTTTFSQDLEPEYIQINSDDTIAYVVLQENNAVATVDINAGEVTELYSFGTQEFSGAIGFDASDRDEEINLEQWKVRGFPQPDGFAYVTLENGLSYLITANEGDIKEYEQDDFPFDWSEAQRGNNFEESDFVTGFDPTVIPQVGDNSQLGRLDMSVVDDLTLEGKIQNLYMYGSRDFGIYKVSDFSRVYSSGNEFERKIAEEFPTIFNSNPNSESNTPEQTFDTRSDNRGPEPEAIEYGVSSTGQPLVFVGLERPGFVCIYTIDSTVGNDVPALEFQSINFGGGVGSGRTWKQLWVDRISRDLDAEDLRFIPASRGIAEFDMLAVVGTYSGTLSLYEVYDEVTTPVADKEFHPRAPVKV